MCSRERKIRVGIAAIFVILLAMTMAPFRIATFRQRLNDSVVHARKVIALLERMRQDLIDVKQAAIEGKYAPAAVINVTGDLAVAERIEILSPAQRANLASVRLTLAKRLKLMQLLTVLTQRGDITAAQRIQAQDVKESTNFYHASKQIIDEENRFEERRIQELNAASNLVDETTGIARVVLMAIMVFVAAGVWRTVQDRQSVDTQLALSEARLNEAQSVARIGSFEYDYVRNTAYWSDEMYRLLGYPSVGQVPGLEHLFAVDPANVEDCEKVRKLLQNGEPCAFDVRMAGDGRPDWIHVIGKMDLNADGQVVRLFGTVMDVSERKNHEEQWREIRTDQTEANARLEAANQQLEMHMLLVNEQAVELELQKAELELVNAKLTSLATSDGLTGLANHRAFQERLVEEWARSRRYGSALSIVMLDVDKFKDFNDSFGHPEGDRVLKQVAEILRRTARETDIVARYGGEEFIVLLPNTDSGNSRIAAERLREAVAAFDWPLRQVTASFGAATLSLRTASPQELVDLADKAMYRSKEAGRDRVTLADTPVPV